VTEGGGAKGEGADGGSGKQQAAGVGAGNEVTGAEKARVMVRRESPRDSVTT